MKTSFTALLLLLVALPVNAATTVIHGPELFKVDRNTPYTATISAEAYESLTLSFLYDARELDTPSVIQTDKFEYGVVIDGVEEVLGVIRGVNQLLPEEMGSVNKVLPSTADEKEFTVFARLIANTDSDVVRLTDITVTGEPVWDGIVNTPETAFQRAQGVVTICHFDDMTERFYQEEVNIASIVKGRGHGQHLDDIIPLFWYQASRGVDITLFGGNDWNTTNRDIYLNNCEEGE